MNKYILKIAFLALLSLGFVACSNDDVVDDKEQMTFHDENGNYVPITIQADYGEYNTVGGTIGSRVSSNPSEGTECLTSISGKWESDDKLVVVFDNKVSELSLSTGSGAKSGTFSGKLYYSSSVFSASKTLYFYVKSDYLEVDATSPTNFKMVDIEDQDGTYEDAFQHTVWYGLVTSYKKTGMSVSLTPQTAILNFKLKGPLSSKGTYYADMKLKGYGWGNNASELVEFKSTLLPRTAMQFYYCVKATNKVKGEKVVVTLRDKVYERLIGDENKEITYNRASIYNKPDDAHNTSASNYVKKLDDYPTLRIGDYLYSDGGWGDDPTPETGHTVIGIVVSKKSNFGDGNDNLESYHGTAMSLRTAGNSVFSTAAPSTVSYTGKFTSWSAARSASGLTLCNNMLKKSSTIFSAVNMAKAFSSTVPVPADCSDWYLPSCAEIADLINNVGKKGTYSYSEIDDNWTWAGTEWEELTWTGTNNCPTAAFAAINEYISRVKGTTINSTWHFQYNTGLWAADYQSTTEFTRVSMGGATKHPYMDARAYSNTHQVRPFIQF